MSPWVDVLVLNGPGTAVILVAVSWIRRVSDFPYIRIVLIEVRRSAMHTNHLRRIIRQDQLAFIIGKDSEGIRRHLCGPVARGCWA
jgi:hypothetical protein